MTFRFWKSIDQLLCKTDPIFICLIFPRDYIEIINVGQEHYRSGNVPFCAHDVGLSPYCGDRFDLLVWVVFSRFLMQCRFSLRY